MSQGANEVRSPRKQRLLGRAAGWFIKILAQTWVYDIATAKATFGRRQVIYALWHDGIIGTPPIWRYLDRDQDATVLTSASKDGAVLAEAMAVFGLNSARGSSSRRGAQALRDLLKVAKSGESLVVTPDGPKGPRHEVQTGVLKLAQLTGLPIVPMRLIPDSAWRFRTWDRLALPKPYSRVTLHFGETLAVPRDLSEAAQEEIRVRLQHELGIYD